MRLKINIDIFDWSIIVHLTDDIIGTYRRIGGVDCIDPEAITYTAEYRTHILLGSCPTHEAISHEVMHACDDMLSSRGIHLHTGTEEVYAYAVGYVTGRIYRYMARHGIEAQ